MRENRGKFELGMSLTYVLCFVLRVQFNIYNYTYISGSERRLFTTGNSGNVIDFSLLMMQSFFQKSHGLFQFVILYTKITISNNHKDYIQRVMWSGCLLLIPFFPQAHNTF